MMNYLSYIFLFILVLIFVLFFKVVTYFEFKKTKLYFKHEKEKIKVTEILAEKKKRYNKKEFISLIERYPTVYAYINQIDILLKDAYCFENTRISTLKKNECIGFDLKKFTEEMNDAPNELKKEVIDLSEILGKIYSWEHPFRYRIRTFKKNIVLRILSILIVFLEKKEKDNKFRRRSYTAFNERGLLSVN